jgi:hypothetical protein
VTVARLELTGEQVLRHRRRVGALDERLPLGPASLRRAAWAGLQDSVPRAAALSIHARVHGTAPDTWADPSLIQLWGPRFSAYVVAAQDLAVFTLGRLPDDAPGRRRADDLARRLDAFLDGRRMPYGEAGRGLGVPPNSLRYAAATGTLLIRWDGARQPTVWTVPRPDVDPGEARLELARRYLHVFGPATPAAFAGWAGIRPAAAGRAAFDALGASLTRTHSAPPGDPRRPRGCSPAATPTRSCREPTGSSWSPTPSTVARSGPRGSGPAPSSWRVRSSGRGDARRPMSRSRHGAGSHPASARRSR